MDTMAVRGGRRWLVVLALAALGCGDAPADDPNARGELGGADGGAAATGGMTGAGGGASAVGGRAGGTGGATGAGGAPAGAGGVTGAGGATATYPPCIVYNWDPSNEGGCNKLVSIGVYQVGYKDGHRCGVCSNPTRMASVAECTFGAGSDLCVLNCNECVYQ